MSSIREGGLGRWDSPGAGTEDRKMSRVPATAPTTPKPGSPDTQGGSEPVQTWWRAHLVTLWGLVEWGGVCWGNTLQDPLQEKTT